MSRFTDVTKRASSVLIPGPIPPEQTASTPFGTAPPPGIPAGSSSIAQGGMPTGLQVGPGQMNAGGAAIRSDQPQPQPGMQTTQSLPQTKAPGAAKAFTPPKGQSLAKPSITPPKPPSAKISRAYPLKFAGPMLPALAAGLGMAPEAFAGGLVDKGFGALEAAHRAHTLFRLPETVMDAGRMLMPGATPAVSALDQRKAAAHGLPGPPPAGAMPENPAAQFGSFMDVVRPLKNPLQSAQNFVQGLGSEADRQLTRSMIEQPVTIHQMEYQQHPTVTH